MQESQQLSKNKNLLFNFRLQEIVCRISPSFTTSYLTCKKYTIF